MGIHFNYTQFAFARNRALIRTNEVHLVREILIAPIKPLSPVRSNLHEFSDPFR